MPSKSPYLLMLLVSVGFATLTGCVQRRILIRSNPPGALVKIDDYEIGTTPVATSFLYYGTRKIEISKSGFETLTVLQPIPSPWYQKPGVDFFSENVVPHEIRDVRALNYQLQPAVSVPTDQLIDRGQQLRDYGQAVPFTPQVVPTQTVPVGPTIIKPGPSVPAPQPQPFELPAPQPYPQPYPQPLANPPTGPRPHDNRLPF